MNEATATETGTRRAARTQTRKGKGRVIIAVGLAALAVTGMGAAATSAAWTDNVFFSAQAQAATFNLQGSLDGTTWLESNNAGAIEIVVPATTFANLLPGQSRQVELRVKNLGSVSAALSSTVAFTGSTFAANPAAVVSDLATSVAAGGNDTFVLTVTAPSDWPTANQGKSATIVVTIAGTATAA
ncbi:MAG TPA: hypothetical protein VNT50_11185 [Microbacterium sp.]|uniref:hypothetical protein n=1 Tax=Microbacterium sp. TaxID=51671 RepID=UPI002C5FDD77|nr:hypothetical protein [Microbacterium sp.]HWI32047.1 hypothetical protein [Microbacterium sp.]